MDSHVGKTFVTHCNKCGKRCRLKDLREVRYYSDSGESYRRGNIRATCPDRGRVTNLDHTDRYLDDKERWDVEFVFDPEPPKSRGWGPRSLLFVLLLVAWIAAGASNQPVPLRASIQAAIQEVGAVIEPYFKEET